MSPASAARSPLSAHADGVDPVGACVGPRGSRVRMVVSELRGEKIDIIPLQRGARTLRRQGARAGARPRGARRRREPAGNRDRARRPALAGDRPRRPERPPRGPPDRLAHRHPFRKRLRGRRRRKQWRGERASPRPLAAATRSSPTAVSARTPRSPDRATAVCRPTRRWSTRRPTTSIRRWPTQSKPPTRAKAPSR